MADQFKHINGSKHNNIGKQELIGETLTADVQKIISNSMLPPGKVNHAVDILARHFRYYHPPFNWSAHHYTRDQAATDFLRVCVSALKRRRRNIALIAYKRACLVLGFDLSTAQANKELRKPHSLDIAGSELREYLNKPRQTPFKRGDLPKQSLAQSALKQADRPELSALPA